MKILLCQVDGKIPNRALMVLSTWHRRKGDEVRLLKNLNLRDETYQPDRVYSSSLFFNSSIERRKQIKDIFPEAIVGGDGYYPIWNNLAIIGRNLGSNLREVITDDNPDSMPLDYSHYPEFLASLGYSQRGCRLNCDFCRMQTREGTVRNVSTLHQIWRGDSYPRHLHLLDNDFFGQTNWKELLDEAIVGKFKICFNQGINIRLVNSEQAQALAKVYYADDSFKSRRLYTAWDNLGDEQIFKRGVKILTDGGIPARHLMVYMLIGFKEGETEEETFYRYNELINLGCKVYPMVFNRKKLLQCRFQKWVVGRYAELCTWPDFRSHYKSQYRWDEDVEYKSRYESW